MNLQKLISTIGVFFLLASPLRAAEITTDKNLITDVVTHYFSVFSDTTYRGTIDDEQYAEFYYYCKSNGEIGSVLVTTQFLGVKDEEVKVAVRLNNGTPRYFNWIVWDYEYGQIEPNNLNDALYIQNIWNNPSNREMVIGWTDQDGYDYAAKWLLNQHKKDYFTYESMCSKLLP